MVFSFQSLITPTVLLPESFRGGCSFGANGMPLSGHTAELSRGRSAEYIVMLHLTEWVGNFPTRPGSEQSNGSDTYFNHFIIGPVGRLIGQGIKSGRMKASCPIGA